MAARLNRFAFGIVLLAPLGVAALQDPTALPGAPAQGTVAGQAFPLTAIKQAGNRRVAIVGNQEIAVGDRYQGWRVVRITESEVLLRRDGETTVHKLYPQVDKRPRGR